MGQLDTHLVLYCKEEDRERWKAAMGLYEVTFANLTDPLEQSLLQAETQKADLFVIVDGAQESDEVLLAGVQRFREAQKRNDFGMRIAFVSDAAREVPSYLFRVLANFDVLDIVAPPRVNPQDYNPYYQLAEVISKPKCYSDIVALLTGNVINPKLIGLSTAEGLREKTRAQVRIAVAQMDQRRGGSTHTTILLARTLLLLGYKTAVFVDARTWKNMRRCYPRSRCNAANGLLVLGGIDFYKNEGFARINGYDYVIADFGCARWIDLQCTEEAAALEENFKTAQLAVLTSVVSPLGDHTPLERVLKIWQKTGQVSQLGGVKFALFGLPNEKVLENWRTAVQHVNPKAELYGIPYLPDPLNYEPQGAHCPELIGILSPVLRAKER